METKFASDPCTHLLARVPMRPCCRILISEPQSEDVRKKLKTDNMLTDPRLKLDQQPYLPNTPAACQLLSTDFPSGN